MLARMRYCPKYALPSRVYRPSSGDPVPALVVEGSERALDRADFRTHDGFAYGLDLFNHGFLWEAHEVWERAWRASEGSERELLQGLIQLAAAALNRAAGKSEGADRVTARAQGHIDSARQSAAILCGIDLDSVMTDAGRGSIPWKIRSRDLPGTRSDFLVQPLECEFALSSHGVVQTTPSRKDYFSGNTLALDEPTFELTSHSLSELRGICAEQIATDARYHNVHWEVEGAQAAPPKDLGFDVDHFVVLRAGQLSRPPSPADVEIRELVTDDDWLAAGGLTIEINLPQFSERYVPFARWRYASYRETVEVCGGAFYGAFVGDEIASCIGVVASSDGFRFQDVQTREAFRRRGIARAMCVHAFEAMRSAGRGHGHGVIVAEAGTIAEKIYRSIGFEQVSTQYRAQFKLGEESAP